MRVVAVLVTRDPLFNFFSVGGSGTTGRGALRGFSVAPTSQGLPEPAVRA